MVIECPTCHMHIAHFTPDKQFSKLRARDTRVRESVELHQEGKFRGNRHKRNWFYRLKK
jgi:hypothetical protein